MVVAASPSPAPATHAAAGRPHPTYTKMITRALTDLGGSSPRPSIAGYILARFSGLPASHDALLSAHLRRLLTEGVLRTHAHDGADSPSYILEEKLGPGRPRKDTSHASAPAAPVPVPVVGEKRGRGRPRKRPPAQGSSHGGIATPSLLPAKRKHAQSPGSSDDAVTKGGPGRTEVEHNWAFQNGGDATPVQSGGASSMGAKRGRGRPRKENPPPAAVSMSPESGNVAPSTGIKRGPGRPRKEKPSPAAMSPAAGSVATSRGFNTGCGRPSLQNPSAAAAAAMSPQSGNVAPSTGIKRGRGRPRKEKPSPAGLVAASRGFKRGCGRPSLKEPSAATAAAASYENGIAASMGIKTGGGTPRMDRPAGFEAGGGQSIMEKLAAVAAAMYDENGGDAASAGVQSGGGQSRFEKLAAVAALSAEGIKRGRGRPRKERPPASARVKRSRGTPRKHQSITGLVDAACEVLFREASTRREEDLDFVSAEKTQTKCVAHGGRKEASAVDAGCVPVSGQNAATAPAGAMDSNLGPANLGDDVVSTGVNRGRGRPRKKKRAAAMSPETRDDASAGIKPGGGTPRMDESSAAMSAETRDAASREVKRPRGRPRKEKPAAAAAATSASTGVKRGRGRPMKVGSIGTWFAEAAAERALFGHMAEEAPGDSVSAGKTQAEGVAAPGGREEARVADDAGRIPVSGESAATAPVEAGNGSDLGPASL